MAKWPDSVPFPKPVKPEGITEWEWQVYMNSEYRSIDPELKAKVHAAMGWKVNDVEAAEEIAGLVASAVERVDGKGHVPEENLPRYRRLKQVAEKFGSLGSQLSGIGQYGDANLAWQLEAKYQAIANQLRADLPEDGDTSPQP